MWIVGIDEAGYGPNLGPFVMTAVACRAPTEHEGADLWGLLGDAVRRAADPRDDRLVVDDSKEVFKGARGLGGLERALVALAGGLPPSLAQLVERLCPDDHADLARERWYTGATPLPAACPPADLDGACQRFGGACSGRSVGSWLVRSVVLCPPRFNALADEGGSKGAVLGHGFIRLLRWALEVTDGPEPLAVFIDKQGGRNAYAAQIQQALPAGLVAAVEEGLGRSAYRVLGIERSVRLTFQPRADSTCFCVALASMVSKYLRELFMGEFNRFWQQHVPGLAPTAGYPGDAARFLDAIRAAAATLEISEEAIWRRR
jgi:ribonuclease HII